MKLFPDRERPSVLKVNTRFYAQRKKKARWIGIVVVFTTVASLAVMLWLGTQLSLRLLFSQNDLFRITDIRIECTGEAITPDHVLEYTRLDSCSNLFAFNIKAMRNDLQRKVPVIESVYIQRKLPGSLIIRVNERTPVARLDKHGYLMVIDDSGHVLGRVASGKNLPIISGLNTPGIKPGVLLAGTTVMNALDVIRVCETTPIGRIVKPASINVSQKEWLDLRLVDGERVLFSWLRMGEGTPLAYKELQKKMLKLVDNLKSATARGKRISLIDMTLENNFPAQEY